MATEKGFTEFISDFAGAIKENSVDIIETTKGIETLLTDTLDYIADDQKLEDMVGGIRSALDKLLEKLETGDLLNTEVFETQLAEIVEKINGTIGVDLGNALDPGNIFQSVKDMIPDDAFSPELEKMFKKIKEFFENIDLSDVQIRIKAVTEPVEKPKASSSGSSSFESLGAASLPSNFDVFGPATVTTTASTTQQITNNAAEIDSLLDKVTQGILDQFLNKESLIDGILNKLEKAIVESGFYNELEEKREAFIATLTSGGLTIKKIFKAISQLVIDLIGSAIRTILVILDVLVEDLKSFLQAVKGLTSINAGSIVEGIFEQFGIENFKPGILSLPAFLISVPYTLVTKAVTGNKPEFPKIFQDAATDTNNKVYGAVQIIKSIGPFIGLASDKIESKPGAIVVGLLGNLFGPTLDIFGQLHSEPLHPGLSRDKHKAQTDKFFGYRIWEYQWFYNVAWSYLTAVINAFVDIVDYKVESAPRPLSASLAGWENKLPKMKIVTDFVIPSFQVIWEIIHLGLFSYLFTLEEKAIKAKENSEPLDGHVPVNDARARAGYMFDAFPGIVGGVISIVKAVVDRKIEPFKQAASTSALQAKTEINQRILALQGTILAEIQSLTGDAPHLVTFHGIKGSTQNYGDLDTYLNLIDTGIIQPSTAIRTALQQINEADKSEDSVRLTKAVSDALDRIPDLDWIGLINKHKTNKILIETFRANTEDLMNDILAGLNVMKDNLNNGNANTVQAQIVILQGWKDLAIAHKGIVESSIKKEVKKNKLLGGLFVDNAGQTSLVSAAELALSNLENLITRLSLLNGDPPAKKQLPLLIAQKSILQRNTNSIKTKKNNSVQQLLRLFPASNRSHNRENLFPPLETPKKSLEVIVTEINAIIQNAQTLGGTINPAEIRKLETSQNVLTGIDITVNLVLQIIYGSLYVNTGVNPEST